MSDCPSPAPVFLCPVSLVPRLPLLLASLTQLITNLSLGIICTTFIWFCHRASLGNWWKRVKIRYNNRVSWVRGGMRNSINRINTGAGSCQTKPNLDYPFRSYHVFVSLAIVCFQRMNQWHSVCLPLPPSFIHTSNHIHHPHHYRNPIFIFHIF